MFPLPAYYYFELVRLFKNVPLITVPLLPDQINTVTQASPTTVYDQIEQDLTIAKSVLPTDGVFRKDGGEIRAGFRGRDCLRQTRRI